MKIPAFPTRHCYICRCIAGLKWTNPTSTSSQAFMGALSSRGDAVNISAIGPIVWHFLLDKRNGHIVKALSACRAVLSRTIAGPCLSQTLFSSGLPAVETVFSSCNQIAVILKDGAQGLVLACSSVALELLVYNRCVEN